MLVFANHGDIRRGDLHDLDFQFVAELVDLLVNGRTIDTPPTALPIGIQLIQLMKAVEARYTRC